MLTSCTICARQIHGRGDSAQGRERVKLRVARFAVHSIGLLARLAPARELKRVLDPKPRRFRIQFPGVSPDRGPSILREVEIEVVDVSAAIIAAANIAWPPRRIGLRILDSEGREVFSRQKVNRR
jgi:hypothetical protein